MEEFFEICKGIRYGWTDDGGKYFEEPDYRRYRLQAPDETLRKKTGICWDLTELEREWFEKQGYEIKTFLIYYYVRDDYCPSHSVLAFREKEGWGWFEPMFRETKVKNCGIYYFETLEELLRWARERFGEVAKAEGLLSGELEERKWCIYEYGKPRIGMRDAEFYEFCRKGKRWEV